MSALLYCIFLGIVEGITEFLPVSSTGHLFLITNRFGWLRDEEFTKTFNIFIQIGAIAAVVVYFRRRILELLFGPRANVQTPLEIAASGRSSDSAASVAAAPAWASMAPTEVATAAERQRVIAMILLATIPVLIIGRLTNKWVETHLENRPSAIAAALAIGGLVMIVIEWLPTNVTARRVEGMSWMQAMAVGFIQVLSAVFPGTSRSAATIMGGMAVGLSRAAATEFSFFLAIPAMTAACGYKLWQYLRAHPHVSMEELLLLAIGTIVSFFVAWLVIAAFMGYVRRHNFIPFAIYRIALGVLVILYFRHSSG